jgi:hypothetical protein
VSKSKQKKHNSFDDNEQYDFRQETREHRRMKRLNSALKTKNLDELIHLDEDYD